MRFVLVKPQKYDSLGVWNTPLNRTRTLHSRDLQAAYAMIVAERQARIAAEAEALLAKAKASSTEATIAHLKLMIEKLKRELYGSRPERTVRLIDQMELQLEELEATASEDEIAAEAMARQALPAGAGLASPSCAKAVPREPAA